MPVDTRTLDHIVHLTPPGTVEEASNQWRDLGFKVLPGGVHTDGLTANALVVLSDGVYIELISFTHPLSHYPPDSPEHKKRDNHNWAHLPPGWIDFAFLGTGSRAAGESISQTINERAKKEGSGVEYAPEADGGRTRTDGVVLKWLISGPKTGRKGVLPFFCGDVTPRELRVPTDPPSNTVHPSATSGIAYVHVLVDPASFDEASNQLASVIGHKATTTTTNGARKAAWDLHTPGGSNADTPRLILTTPVGGEEESFVKGAVGGKDFEADTQVLTMVINTQTLDHIVHITPPGSVDEVSKQFKELGFKVLPGGSHTDNLTQNALVVFPDGVYLELISFVHPLSYYRPGTPEHHARDTHQWAHLPSGWIDFAFLGNGLRSPSQSISRLINERSKKEGSGIEYDLEVEQGRVRHDGVQLRWLISQATKEADRRGVVPFFCGDVKPSSRKLRVPSDPPSNTSHPSNALGIAFVRVVVKPSSFDKVFKQLKSVVGFEPTSTVAGPRNAQASWELETVNLNAKKKRSRLILSSAESDEEREFVKNSIVGRGIFEVGFFVKGTKVPETKATPWGKISWVKGG
ncbi:hypothetical protein CVT26_010778 [Gymnopilus dilepis]|uniref:Glyoxalase-like domain-containing protein n=1 Tax=Gymnopilus dilepis TaxID=231916 RepID=A0A409VIC5_9AGAR|nr:hypothetical protein CVT26_010778 [Gymnopilus dilepis]